MNQTNNGMRSNEAPKTKRGAKGLTLPRRFNAVAYAAALEVLG